MFDTLKKQVNLFFGWLADSWRPTENKLTVALGVVAFCTFFWLQFPVLLAAASAFSTMFLSYTLAKAFDYIHKLATDFHTLVQKMNDKLEKTDETVNEKFSPKALELMEQACSTLAALEAQMPELGQGLKTMKAFQKSTMGSVVGSLLGVGKPKSAPAPEASAPPAPPLAPSSTPTDRPKQTNKK